MQERMIPESELQETVAAMVRIELAKMLNLSPQGGHHNQEWFNTPEAYKKLGYGSAIALYDAVATGLLRLGKEVRDRRKPGSKNPIYQFHIEKCEKRLLENPDKRRAV
jgi:hypothetical protein